MDAERIRRLLQRQKIATMPELKDALGTDVDVTVFRKLRELAHRTSYSHRGKYYTLDEIARFDALGLWSFRSVWFSKHGTLVRTCEVLVAESEAGYFTEELEATLHVGVKDALRKLASEDRIAREKVASRFLHTSADRTTRRTQLRARQVRMAHPGELVAFGAGTRVLPDELKAAIVLFFALLDERQRRLYAGLESLKLGHGGDQRIAELLGLDAGTVARGRRELLAQDVEAERVRRKGAGRPRTEKKRPK
ncbi:MAG: hypothetical protein ACRENI_01660 [Gemmatimonadaceae bacterium]